MIDKFLNQGLHSLKVYGSWHINVYAAKSINIFSQDHKASQWDKKDKARSYKNARGQKSQAVEGIDRTGYAKCQIACKQELHDISEWIVPL